MTAPDPAPMAAPRSVWLQPATDRASKANIKAFFIIFSINQAVLQKAPPGTVPVAETQVLFKSLLC
jgi:hypothetical protein